MNKRAKKTMTKKSGFWDMFGWTEGFANPKMTEWFSPLFKYDTAEPGSRAVERNGKILSRNQLDKITGADKLRVENKKLKKDVETERRRADVSEASRLFDSYTGQSGEAAQEGAGKPWYGSLVDSVSGFAKNHPLATTAVGSALAAIVVDRIMNSRRRKKYASADQLNNTTDTNMNTQDRYITGFLRKCAASGVDKRKAFFMLKQAAGAVPGPAAGAMSGPFGTQRPGMSKRASMAASALRKLYAFRRGR